MYISRLFRKNKTIFKKAALACGLFLGIFFVLFELVNIDYGSFLGSSASEKTAEAKKEEVKKWQFKKRPSSSALIGLNPAEWSKENGLTDENRKSSDDPDGDGLSNNEEYAHLTDPLITDTDKDGFSDKQEIINGYDPDAPGDARPSVEIIINKIGITVPMIWSASSDEKSMEADLQNGIAHYPKTASPGQDGNVVVSGHSSNYVWVKGNYNYIFKNLDKLEKDDEVKIRVIQKNKRVNIYTYKVIDKRITTPDDPFIFETTANPSLTLSTCWPINTAYKRLIVRAELTK